MVLQDQGRSPETMAVEQLEDGDHACLTYADDAVRWQVLTVYTWAGTTKEQKVLLILDPDDLRDDEVAARMDGGSGRIEAAWANGQVELRRTPSFYLPDGRFDKERQRKAFVDEVERARCAGWSGLRGGAAMNWMPGVGWDAREIVDYESSVGPVFADGSYTAICWYDRRRCSDYLVAAAREVHPIEVMDRLNAIDVAPAPEGAPVVATSAELFAHGGLTDSVGATLDRLASRGTSQFELDLRDLSFIEAHCATQLIDFAASLPVGSRVTFRCGLLLELLLRESGADTVAQLQLVVEEL